MTIRNLLLHKILPLLVVLAGVGLMLLLIGQRQPPAPVERETPGALVETLTAQPEEWQVIVPATGTVRAERELLVVPQVAGKVVELGENFLAGGHLRRGELLLQIDPADYQLALHRAEAAVRRAEVQLAVTAGQAEAARREWQMYEEKLGSDTNLLLTNGGNQENLANNKLVSDPNFWVSDPNFSDPDFPPSPLALYQPQLEEAEAELAAARADLATARLALERTTLTAPFNARVGERQVAEGQFVTAGAPLGRLIGTDLAEVVVPVPLAELAWLEIPGAPARLTMTMGETEHSRPGRVLRTLGEVEGRGRLVQVVIELADPYVAPALLPGSFVRAEIAGRRLNEVFVLPRRALREDDTLWLVDAEQRLEIRPVTVVRREREVVVVSTGLAAGEQVILTELAGAAPGMPVTVQQHRTFGRSARLAYAGYAAPVRLPESAALLNGYAGLQRLLIGGTAAKRSGRPA